MSAYDTNRDWTTNQVTSFHGPPCWLMTVALSTSSGSLGMHLPKTSTPKVPWPDQGGWCNFSDDTGKKGGVPLLMDRHTAKNASSRREITQMTGPRIFVLCDQEAKPRDWFYQIVKLRNITHSQRLNGVPLNLLIWHELAERFWNSFIRAKFESSINKYNAAFWFITRENINFDSIDTHAPYRAGG